MAKTKRTPLFCDRGGGIGKIAWNDTRWEPGADRRVREIVAYDVFGERMTRLDLDTGMASDGNMRVGGAPGDFTADQIYEVATRDLARLGKAIGDAFGTIYDNTAYGFYSGRRPAWCSKARWAALKGAPTRALLAE